MNHPEIPFCYKIPAGCIRNEYFSSDKAGEILCWVSGGRASYYLSLDCGLEETLDKTNGYISPSVIALWYIKWDGVDPSIEEGVLERET